MTVDRVILLGMMDNYHKLASAGEKLALLLKDGSITADNAYSTARTLASFGAYMNEALDRAEVWGYAEWVKRMSEVLRDKPRS